MNPDAKQEPSLADLPSLIALEVDALCDDFERHWRRSRRRRVSAPNRDDFLCRISEQARPLLLLFLAELEKELCAGVLLPEVPGLVLQEEIGRGGMGVVYRARRAQDDQLVAVKLIPSGEHDRLTEYLAELVPLRHPHLVPLERLGTYRGLHFVVMPLISGGDLREKFSEFVVGLHPTQQRVDRAAVFLAEVASATAYLHDRGILHGDLKPSNILLADPESGTPLVCDFGFARRLDDPTETCKGGTPGYMAPEQFSGQPLTPAADVWGLGAILHELLIGIPPVNGSALPQVTSNRLQPLHQICRHCLEPKREDRYGSAHELMADLHQYLNQTPFQVRDSR